jgi:hypothetical protein
MRDKSWKTLTQKRVRDIRLKIVIGKELTMKSMTTIRTRNTKLCPKTMMMQLVT